MVTVCLKLTPYLRRLQLIMQSANGTAYEPHFAKEADIKEHSLNMFRALNIFTACGDIQISAVI